MTPRTILLGTRGSALALRQTEMVMAELRRLSPERSFALKTITTTGDRAQDVPFNRLEREGVFVKELETALLSRDVDLAVHSSKDLPTAITSGLTLLAFPPRAEVRDVLISSRGVTLEQLPAGCRLGTSSPRRALQLLAARPDLQVLPIRGNVDTRLRKLDEGQYDAIVLAAAGMERLGIQGRTTQYLATEICLPAVGQGALAIQGRSNDPEVAALVAALDDPPTRAAVTAERAFLEALGGGCRVPIAAFGQVRNGILDIEGLVIAENGSARLHSRASGDASRAREVGQALAEEMMRKGAGELLGLSR